MAIIINEKEILQIVKEIDLLEAMREAFTLYSEGNAVVPPVGELLFKKPPGETHIKYGYIKGKEYFTIKIASGFPLNSQSGLSTSQGMMLLFSQKTGEIVAILLDNGKLTDLRTAAAGVFVSKHFAPTDVRAIGILGTGIQAKLQLQFHIENLNCTTVWLWGRSADKVNQLKEQSDKNIDIHIADDPSEVAKHCNLIVTATSAKSPLLTKGDIKKGTHITAVGSDTPRKQELSADLLGNADLVIVDSLSQSKARGEVFHAVREGSISHADVIEFGSALSDKNLGRVNDDQITIADLTGVAVQDMMTAEAVYTKYLKKYQHEHSNL